MRTTLNLSDQLVAVAKARAAREGRTLTSLVEEGLRRVVEQDATRSAEPAPLPTFGDPDGTFLVDILDKDALWGVPDGD